MWIHLISALPEGFKEQKDMKDFAVDEAHLSKVFFLSCS
jgi:hypothetical protein